MMGNKNVPHIHSIFSLVGNLLLVRIMYNDTKKKTRIMAAAICQIINKKGGKSKFLILYQFLIYSKLNKLLKKVKY